MSKRGHFGWHVTGPGEASARNPGAQRCIRCGVQVVYGDRCEQHKRELRQRRKRKLR